MPTDKPEAPVRDNATVQIEIRIGRNKIERYSGEEGFVSVKLDDASVLAAGKGGIEDNHSTFVNLLEQVLGAAKGRALEQLEEHVASLRKAREDREAKERAAEAAEEHP